MLVEAWAGVGVPVEGRRGIGPFWSCHKPCRVTAEGRSMGEAWVDVGVLVERKCDMGPLLELNQMSAHVDCWGRRGCAGGRQAWHGPLLEMRQMGVPVGRRLGGAWVYRWKGGVA